MRPEGFPRRLRVSRRRDFLRIQRTGRKLHTRHFMVFVLVHRERDAAAEPGRLGITVTRRVANAVGRNRIKRIVREAFRRERARMRPGFDLVWVAKREAASATFAQVVQQMRDIADQIAIER